MHSDRQSKSCHLSFLGWREVGCPGTFTSQQFEMLISCHGTKRFREGSEVQHVSQPLLIERSKVVQWPASWLLCFLFFLQCSELLPVNSLSVEPVAFCASHVQFREKISYLTFDILHEVAVLTTKNREFEVLIDLYVRRKHAQMRMCAISLSPHPPPLPPL